MKFETKQQYYDEIVKRLRDGRLPAYKKTEGGIRCSYDNNNKQCLIGMAVDNPKNLGNGSIAIIIRYDKEVDKELGSSLPFFERCNLDYLQKLHDDVLLNYCGDNVCNKINANIKKVRQDILENINNSHLFNDCNKIYHL